MLEPPLDAQLQHGLLVHIQIDAGLRVDEAAQAAEIRVGYCFLATAHRINGALARPTPFVIGLPYAAALLPSAPRTATSSSAEKTRSMSRIMMNSDSRFPMPLIKSVRIRVPILGGG